MVNVNSDQVASVTVPITCFSSFIALGINFCDLDFIWEKFKRSHLYAKCAVPLWNDNIFYLIYKMNPMVFKDLEPVRVALITEFLGNQLCNLQPCSL